MLLILLACTSPKDSVDSSPTDDSDSEDEDSEDEDSRTNDACVSGVARDYDNQGAPSAAVRAWDPTDCTLLNETTANVGGVFCIEVPPEMTFELQVLYDPAERCAWWHGHAITSLAVGDCLDSGTGPCRDLGVLFECDAETAICGGE
ncbi:MAG TPA: hypothetical protein QGF58_25490 [Myxococcota bacterium]|nr:hypothetical protein [Myxococcota bacterium]